MDTFDDEIILYDEEPKAVDQPKQEEQVAQSGEHQQNGG